MFSELAPPLHNGVAQDPGVPAATRGEWHFVALSVSPTTMTFVWDDFAPGSFESRPWRGFTGSPGELAFGRYFRGKLDEIKVMTTQLTANQILSGPMWRRGIGGLADGANNGKSSLATKADVPR